MTGLFVQIKLQFRAIVDAVFPEYVGVFGALYSQVSLKTLAAFPTAQSVLSTPVPAIVATICTACPSRPMTWATTKAQQLWDAAERNPVRTVDVPHQAFSLGLYLRMIDEYQAHLKALNEEIAGLVQDMEVIRLIQSIPGIGMTLAATIMAEIGEIGRFATDRKLVACVGVDPRVHESGQFKATINRITKRGAFRLRHALFLAVLCSLRPTGSKRLQAFYHAKRAAGKPHKVAVVACINKLVRWIYAVLTRQEAFVDVA